MNGSYRAPWSRLLKSISFGATVILLGVSILVSRTLGPDLDSVQILIVAGPLLLILGSLLFTVRGYEIFGGELQIRRLLWSTRVSLDGLRSARAEPGALAGSLRLFGNGGLFSFTGIFRNKKLGTYRAYVTDHKNVVILSWSGRSIVISPDQPVRFVDELVRSRGLSG